MTNVVFVWKFGCLSIDPPHPLQFPILSVGGGGMEYFGFDFHIYILKKGFFFVVCIAFLNYVSSN